MFKDCRYDVSADWISTAAGSPWTQLIYAGKHRPHRKAQTLCPRFFSTRHDNNHALQVSSEHSTWSLEAVFAISDEHSTASMAGMAQAAE